MQKGKTIEEYKKPTRNRKDTTVSDKLNNGTTQR